MANSIICKHTRKASNTVTCVCNHCKQQIIDEVLAVSEVSTFVAPGGTEINWISVGKNYSVWTSGAIDAPFTLVPGFPILIADNDDIPILKAYKGDPMYEIGYVLDNLDRLREGFIVTIGFEGVTILPQYNELAINVGDTIKYKTSLVLDVED